jgi:prepilin-type N-terminal cleavage/methylation domain-containing protein
MRSFSINDRGFSMVEVLIAIVILLMIVIVFTTLFNSSIRGIVSSGDRSSTLFELQKDLEAENSVPTIIDNQPMNITFGNGVDIQGKQGSFKQTMADGNEVLINVFIPD